MELGTPTPIPLKVGGILRRHMRRMPHVLATSELLLAGKGVINLWIVSQVFDNTGSAYREVDLALRVVGVARVARCVACANPDPRLQAKKKRKESQKQLQAGPWYAARRRLLFSLGPLLRRTYESGRLQTLA